MIAISAIPFVFVAASQAQSTTSKPHQHRSRAERIQRIENGFTPISLAPNEAPVKLTLQQIMQVSNVTQMSIAVIDDYRIDWAKGYGITDAGRPVTPQTLFPACSISKTITTLSALRLAEAGKLNLDEDVNRRLQSWKVPENEFTRERKVTIRRILTHTAGTVDNGFPGYKPGQPMPTLLQVLNGEKPADTAPVRVAYTPGNKQSYSGSGFLILQQLMIDVTGQPFRETVKESVFDPLRLKDSTYDPNLPPGRIATGRDRNGEPVPTYSGPELAVGGLWTTPSDLARIAIAVALSKHGRSRFLLSEKMTREMLRVQVNPDIQGAPAGGPETRTGLGWFLGDGSDPFRFEHSGVNIGFSTKLLMWDSGHGVVIMANNWAFETKILMRYVINAVAQEYGWSYRVPTFTRWPYADTVLLASAQLRGAEGAIAEYHELKKQWAEQQHKVGDLQVVWASNPPDYPPTQWDLYGIAKALDNPKHLYGAIEIEKLETEEYPRWAEAFRYLGELCARAGQRTPAIQAYEKVLELKPGDQDATEALNRLQKAAQ
jgi:CubicO group peptidase (beta-lactamase class C family)